MEKRDITPAVAARLVAAQFPQWADLPVVPVAMDGWDNTTFRLGEELSIRLPSDDGYVAQIDKEHRWLPVLASQLPVRIPEPVAKGRPDDRFPRPWSIYRWLEGQTATGDRMLVNDGVLEAVIDFGCMAAGDPACDLVMAWTFFDEDSRSVFRDIIDLDDATWSRARGWALWKALITHVRASETGTDPDATVRRFGWRFSALDVVECVLADHA